MSTYFSNKYSDLTPYVPGEQPRDQKYIKLNTNESPFPPSTLGVRYAKEELKKMRLYSDPEVRDLTKVAAAYYQVSEDELLFTNGSDEILNFAFMAYTDKDHPAVFPDLTYGFYKVFAELNGTPYETLPLNPDFTVNTEDYIGIHKTIFIANPNAPTGVNLPLENIKRILESNPENIVVVDEAYVDFGGESAVPLIHQYKNLLVTQTFSKSRSMAGARLGVGIACKELIQDLNTIKFSTNPYNVNRSTMAMGLGALLDDKYMKKNCKEIMENRLWTGIELGNMGFTMTDSKTNFLFVKHKTIPGETIYKKLREKQILVRYFGNIERIKEYNRITIGCKKDMKILVEKMREILEEEGCVS